MPRRENGTGNAAPRPSVVSAWLDVTYSPAFISLRCRERSRSCVSVRVCHHSFQNG